MHKLALACSLMLTATLAPDAAAQCAPPKLVRLVVAQVDVTDPTRRDPKRVFFRLGNGHARIEEQPNADTGIHLLTVVNLPRVWQIDLNTKTGMVALDPDDPPKFVAPIFSDERLPKEFEQYELGCEMEFIADPEVAHEAIGDKGMKHFVQKGAWRFTMLTLKGENTPMSALISKDGKTVVAVSYSGYQIIEREMPELFAPPQDVKIDPAKSAPGV